MSKGHSPYWYSQKLKEIKTLLAKYEIDVEEYYSEYWVFKISYQRKKLFDYYPKNRKLLRISRKGNRIWETLKEDYLEHLKNICEGYTILKTIDVNFKP